MIWLWFLVKVSDPGVFVEVMLQVVVHGRVTLVGRQAQGVWVAPNSVLHPGTVIIKLLSTVKL